MIGFLIGTLYSLGMYGTAFKLVSSADPPDAFSEDISAAHTIAIVFASVFWPYHWAARAFDGAQVRLLPAPGETA